MPFHTVIRERRKELGLTQEQLAGYLGVAAPAVNKWERGNSYPDVGLLPVLARVLKTDLNTLLCFQQELTDQEIQGFQQKLAELFQQQGFSAMFSAAMEKVREYPVCGKLLHRTAVFLDGVLLLEEMEQTEKEDYQKEILALYEQAVSQGDGEIRSHACYMLCSKYMAKEEYEKAQKMLDALPEESSLDKSTLQARLFLAQGKTKEAACILERSLLNKVNGLLPILSCMAETAAKEGAWEKAEKLAKTCESTVEHYELWDYGKEILWLDLAVERQEAGESLRLFRSLLEKVKKPWNPQKTVLYNHIFGDMSDKKPEQKNWETGFVYEKMQSVLLADYEKNPRYEFLRDQEGFWQLLEEFRGK